MKRKYLTALTIILAVLLVVLLLGGGYVLYKKNISKNNAEVIMDENLSINYLNGRKIKFNEKQYEVTFSVINDSETQSMFHINLEEIKKSKAEILYSLYEDDKILVNKEQLNNTDKVSISNFIDIEALETKSYKLVFYNKKQEEVKLKLNVMKASTTDPNFSQIILNNNQIQKDPKTKVGENVAVTEEGLIIDVDDNGNTYYFRGNVTNNYVNFADKLWRIVRINGDGTIKIILDDVLDGTKIYNEKTETEKLNKITTTDVYDYLNNWYDQNLKEYDKYIHESKFCLDIRKEGDSTANYVRINLSNLPTFNCLGTKNNSKIGMLTVDEVIYAGATINESNEHYYLYNSKYNKSWWTFSASNIAVEGVYYYEISLNGNILSNSTGESTKGVRPVINLNKDIQVTGLGTINEPYTLK